MNIHPPPPINALVTALSITVNENRCLFCLNFTVISNDTLYFMSSCFRCKHNFSNDCISVSIDNSMIDFDRLNFDPGNMNKNLQEHPEINKVANFVGKIF